MKRDTRKPDIYRTGAIQTTYFGPTDHRGSRVQAKLLGSGKRLTLPWDHALDSLDNHAAAARALWRKVDTAGLPEPCTENLSWAGSSVAGGGYVFMRLPR